VRVAVEPLFPYIAAEVVALTIGERYGGIPQFVV
jgi:hypothetical protein